MSVYEEHTEGPWYIRTTTHKNDVEVHSVEGPDRELVLSAGIGRNGAPYISCRSMADALAIGNAWKATQLERELAEAHAALNHADSLWMVNCTPMAFSAWREMHADAIAKARAAEEG